MTYLRIFRKYHRLIAPIVFLPLLVTVFTGVIFDLAEAELLGLSKDWQELLMSIHKGGYLGEKLSTLYVILNGLGLLVMLATGISMLKSLIRKQS